MRRQALQKTLKNSVSITATSSRDNCHRNINYHTMEEEFIHIFQGKSVLMYGEEKHHLEPGDAVVNAEEGVNSPVIKT